MPFGLEMKTEEEAFLMVITSTQELKLPSQQWAGYMEDVLQCGMIDLSEQILRLIFAGS